VLLWQYDAGKELIMYYRRGAKSVSRKNDVNVQKFPAADVWAAACAAQRINGEYLKERTHTYDDNYTVTSTKQANKVLVRTMLLEKPELIQDEDRLLGAVVQNYFQCKLMDVLADRANDFTRTAVELAGREEFAANDWLGLATAACLPQSYARGLERDARNETKMEAQLSSQHFGKVGDKVAGELTVLESRYSRKWEAWYVSATVGTNVVLFAYRGELTAGTKHKFKGSVKAHREDNVTQLNRVRLT
jgi:hypothetical protein